MLPSQDQIIDYLIHQILPATWPIWIFFLVFFSYKIFKFLYRWKKFITSGIKDIDRMDGPEFEAYLAWLFKKKGHKVENIGDTGDFGADLLTEYQKKTYVIQAKRYQGNVGVEAIQQTVAAQGYYDTDIAMCVTNSRYTNAAKKLATANDIILWDRQNLIEEISKNK